MAIKQRVPETQRRWQLTRLMQDLHLTLTPYEDSTWEILDSKGNRVAAYDLALVIFNKEDEA